ncbi:hypothetical protein H257_12564 [Aphanomyces astaci]|uniref:Uncharacterized protein n=1 Tax=Aphanomyces astaci TaxID=112090 RepID=W4FY71_APHAT|nr:hypothetical protein H257_12564 [Aphanomyces astaci]ETV72437.1 hypothetical protein H257_12564 [Aphanomyces astaci]|eukprot:XP_009838119.1 hypothetical protein H257_12564 [Aphanomyces astaci]
MNVLPVELRRMLTGSVSTSASQTFLCAQVTVLVQRKHCQSFSPRSCSNTRFKRSVPSCTDENTAVLVFRVETPNCTLGGMSDS